MSKGSDTLISISKKSFFSVVSILAALLLAACVLTLLIPRGAYAYDAENHVIPGTFQFLPEAEGLAWWEWVLSPFLVFRTSDWLMVVMISLFLLILGGTFAVMDKTGGLRAILNRLIERFREKKYVLLRLIVLVFMAFGAFFGIFEESVALMPVLVLLSYSLGWDTLIGIGMTVLAAGFGFASAITNPFSVGIASELAGVSVLSGVLFRILVFAAMYLLLSTFLVRYARRIDKDPAKSLVFAEDREKIAKAMSEQALPVENEKTAFRSFSGMFAVVLFFILALSLLDLFDIFEMSTIPFIALTFLVGGLLSGWLVTKDFKRVLREFGKGAASVAPAILLIVMASSVRAVIQDGGIMDTILYHLSGLLSGLSPAAGILLIYGLVLILEFFIGSASAKAYLIIPILVPLVALVGYTKNLAILAFLFGDGYANVIFPTNSVLLIGLAIVGISYGKWVRWTAVLQVSVFLLTILFLLAGLWIGY